MAAMKVLPFAVGLIGGVPIVSRELEERTASVAWSLSGSRVSWLGRQVAPIGVLLTTAIAFPAFASAMIADERAVIGEQAFQDIGAYGVPAVARAVGAFSLGLFLGVVLGRAVPALILAAGIAGLLFLVSTEARVAWLAQQSPVVVVDAPVDVILIGRTLVDPHGSQLTFEAAMQLAPEGEADAMDWLEENGYRWLGLAVPSEVAMAWTGYETALFTLVGAAGCAGTLLLVNRRRPS